jgi:hypothetical protein
MRPPVFHPLLLLSALTALMGCEHSEGPLRPEARGVETPSPEREIVVVSRAPEVPTYPCVEQCHVDRAPDRAVRALSEFHTSISIEHAAVMHFCDACHDLDNLDEFHLIDGTSVSFDESDRVCGQCHGEKHRDWSRGIHGIQTGSWWGTAYRRTCTACHDPHAPLDGIHLNALPIPANAQREQ